MPTWAGSAHLLSTRRMMPAIRAHFPAEFRANSIRSDDNAQGHVTDGSKRTAVGLASSRRPEFATGNRPATNLARILYISRRLARARKKTQKVLDSNIAFVL